MTKLIIIAGPAFWAASAVRTKIPVPMTAPMPSSVSWKAPSERCRPFFSAVARIASSDFTRPKSPPRSAALAILLPSEMISSQDPNGSRQEGNPPCPPASLATARTTSRALSRRSARQHRPQRAAAEDVKVQVRHLLTRMRAHVGEHAIARFDQPCLARDPAHAAHERSDLGVRRLLRKVVPRHVGALWNHKD